ncbi:MAG: hypothetical protein EA383_17265 [Spirochaetaceae bacterium]|nr:MAG: hypothetical protein EA383_17265 [Spirochaetaceae bacterium]
MAEKGFLKDMTFIGGTCLRDCYGSPRLSEDLDFAGGIDFFPDTLRDLITAIPEAIGQKYGLSVDVSEPRPEFGNTATWKVRFVTRPESPQLPMQRIHMAHAECGGDRRRPDSAEAAGPLCTVRFVREDSRAARR